MINSISSVGHCSWLAIAGKSSFSASIKWVTISSLSFLFLFQNGHRPNKETFLSLNRTEKMEMIYKWDRFKTLSTDQQDSLRSFHKQLNNHPDKEKLSNILSDYHRWLQDLPQQTRASLQDLEPEKRVAKVKELLDKYNQFRPVLGKLKSAELESEDTKVFISWIFKLFQKQNQFRRRWRWGGFKPPNFDESDIKELDAKLSERGKQILELNKHQQKGLVRFWGWTTFRRNPTQQQLINAYDSLDAKEKERLSHLGVDQIHLELRGVLYRMRKKEMTERPDFSSEGPGKEGERRGKRSGERRSSEDWKDGWPEGRSGEKHGRRLDDRKKRNHKNGESKEKSKRMKDRSSEK